MLKLLIKHTTWSCTEYRPKHFIQPVT